MEKCVRRVQFPRVREMVGGEPKTKVTRIMERRKFLLASGALAAGGAAGLGTGAFSSVEAERNVEVAVAGDSAAFLALEPGEENGEYAEETDGTLELNFDDDANVAGSGFNQNAETVIDDVFRIKNQGTQEVAVDLNIVDDNLPQGLQVINQLNGFAQITESGQPDLVRISFDLKGDGNATPANLGIGDYVPVTANFKDTDQAVNILEDFEFELEITAEATD
jgi:hypothetical protein